MPSHRTWTSPLMWVLALSLPLGCSGRGNVALLEDELRQREGMVAELDEQVVTLRNELESANYELVTLRTQLQSPKDQALVAEQAATLSKVEKVAFHSLLTSGFNADAVPGDDRLSVLFQPLDGDGDLLKLGGSIELELFDYALPADRQRIGHWTFGSEDVRKAWHRGLMASGYLFELPWQTAPSSQELVLHGRLTAADQRQFDTTLQVAVKTPASEAAVAQKRRKQAEQKVVAVSREEIVPAQPVRKDDPALVPRVRGAAKVETSDRYKIDEIPQRR